MSFPKYIVGAKYSFPHDCVELGYKAHSPLTVMKTTDQYYNLLLKPDHFDTPIDAARCGPSNVIEFVEDSPTMFYGIRRQSDGAILREGPRTDWRWGRSKMYVTLTGAINRMAMLHGSSVELLQFNIVHEGHRSQKMINETVYALSQEWHDRVGALREHRVFLGAPLLDADWLVAMIFPIAERSKLYESQLKNRTKNICWPANLLYNGKECVLFKRKVDAMKYRLSLPDCEMVYLKEVTQ